MPEPRFDLGDRVTFTEEYVRARTFIEPGADTPWWRSHQAQKTWERRPARPYQTPSSRSGVIVGARTIYDGVAQYGLEDNPTTFTRAGSHQAYVVATSLRGRHTLVPFDAVAALDEA
ncbi:hypothetical protein [Curtobacterium sp. MCSS17_016]|uniref:hypothetical protein n=1 Tax=Curtobacterium sp. MCSS17_016 TaxID=2175644 RepID=UPI0011B3A3D3|nr:hypothetical protein [Curtobacterium sp. MCSS17_016]WIE81169.1 hypothetical protein DEJ19_018220 [Curtobacterium sp. MCSS17_016]